MVRGPLGPVTEWMQADQLVEMSSYVDPLNTTERLALTLIAKLPTISPKQVGDLMGVDKDIMSRTVKKLVGLGWVYERRNPQDRRFAQLGITEAGAAAIEEHVARSSGRKSGTFMLHIRPWAGETFDAEDFRKKYDEFSEILKDYREKRTGKS